MMLIEYPLDCHFEGEKFTNCWFEFEYLIHVLWES